MTGVQTCALPIYDGELGSVYGSQWRSWPRCDGGAIDQIAGLIDTLRHDPDSRRMLVSAWNVGDLDAMALAPCHAFFQCYAAQGRLSLQVYQRSADLFLGVPFNIASYALLTVRRREEAYDEKDHFGNSGKCGCRKNYAFRSSAV